MSHQGTLHSNTDFDPVMRAKALVRELEAEALDEDQVAATLALMASVFADRQKVALQRSSAALQARVDDNRRELVRSKVKGVKAADERPSIIAQLPRPLPTGVPPDYARR